MPKLRSQTTNANAHTERGMQALATSIATDGWIGAVTVAADGEAFDGSARLETGQAAFDDPIVIDSDGSRPVVVRRTDIPNADHERAIRLGVAANRVAELNLAWDVDVLARHRDVLDGGLFTDDEWAEWSSSTDPVDLGGGGDDFDPTPGDGPTRTNAGDLWLIDGGRHRLVVGDCTDGAIVDQLMGGDVFECNCSDPPYGVAIGDKNKFLSSIDKSNRIEINLENDTLDEAQLVDLLRRAWDVAARRCAPGGAWYIHAPPGPLQLAFGTTLHAMGIWRQTIIWVKNNATFSPLGQDYHQRAELIMYGWAPGAAHRYYGGRQQDTVWEIDRPSVSKDHPTMKPIALITRAIENSSRVDEIIFDGFAGSGSTLLAAHAARRRCYAVEIAPRYADVILRRAEAAGMSCERAP